MRIGNSVPVTYTIEDSASLETVDQEKDLCVQCASNLKPSIQCYKVSANASQVLGLINRSFKINLASMLVFLYKMFVHPDCTEVIKVALKSSGKLHMR